jgi:SWI/SNF-related matrix-associated actin-dependent regulator 1 of chromatin subfamily A
MSNTLLRDLVDFMGTLQRARAVRRITENSELHALSSATELGFDLPIPGLTTPLLPYQPVAVLYCERVFELGGAGCMLGEQMGVGKTPTSIAVMLRLARRRTLTVVPPSLRTNWQREWNRFAAGKSVHVITGTKPYQLPDVDVYVIGDSQLHGWKDTLVRIGFDGLIIDEAHRFKDYKAQRSVALGAVSESMPDGAFRLGLSGTAIVNRPSELINVLDVIGQFEAIFDRPLTFLERFMEPEEVWTGREYKTTYVKTRLSEIHTLNTILRGTCYVRRERAQVAKWLPGKFRTNVLVDVNGQLAEYRYANDDYEGWLRNKSGKTDEEIRRSLKQPKLTKLNVLRRLAGEAKVAQAIEYIQAILDTDEPVIVFGHHKNVLGPIADHFQCPTITGSDNDVQKQAACDAFQSGAANVIVGNLTSMGTGWTLTRSCHVVMVEQAWTPGEMNQAEDRADRIGQTRKVQVHYLLVPDSIDEYMRQVVGGKQEILDKVLVGGVQFTEEELVTLNDDIDTKRQVWALLNREAA